MSFWLICQNLRRPLRSSIVYVIGRMDTCEPIRIQGSSDPWKGIRGCPIVRRTRETAVQDRSAQLSILPLDGAQTPWCARFPRWCKPLHGAAVAVQAALRFCCCWWQAAWPVVSLLRLRFRFHWLAGFSSLLLFLHSNSCPVGGSLWFLRERAQLWPKACALRYRNAKPARKKIRI